MHTQKSKPVWFIPLLISVSVIVILVILAALSGTEPAPVAIEVAGEPRAQIDQVSVDHGTVQLMQPVESVFTIRNVGDKVLVIMGEPRVELIEGCCPPRAVVSSTTINPGEMATVSMKYTMHEGMGGPHEFRIHVLTNDPTQEEILLTALSLWEA